MTGSTSQKEIEAGESTDRAGGRLAPFLYRFTYRHGNPRWDSPEAHPELKELVAGRPAGRALDLGCGTGTDAIYLAQHRWEVVGVDFVPEAIRSAHQRALDAGCCAQFVVGDVTRLRQCGVQGPFDLIMDTGCYHGIPAGMRDAYATEVAAVARPGADFYVAGISGPPATWRLLGARGVNAADLRQHFGADFDLLEQRAASARGKTSHFMLYHLVRKQASQSD